MVDRLKNKNGISYDKRPRIPSSSNVCSVDFSFFSFFFLSPLFTSSLRIFWSFRYSFFFFPPLPKVHLIPDFPLVLLVSCLLNVPESLFFFPRSHSPSWHPRVGGAREGRGRIDRPEGRFIRYCVVRTNDNCNSLLESIALVFCPDDESLDRCVKLPVLIVRFYFHFV